MTLCEKGRAQWKAEMSKEIYQESRFFGHLSTHRSRNPACVGRPHTSERGLVRSGTLFLLWLERRLEDVGTWMVSTLT